MRQPRSPLPVLVIPVLLVAASCSGGAPRPADPTSAEQAPTVSRALSVTSNAPPALVAAPIAPIPIPVSPAPACWWCQGPPYQPRFAGPEPSGPQVGPYARPPYLLNPRLLVVERAGVGCPARAGWTGEELFSWGPAAARTTHCRYRWTANTEPIYPRFGGDRVACDQPVIAGHQDGGGPPDESAPVGFCDGSTSTRRRNFFDRLSFDPGYATRDPRPVRVAVVDSAAHAYGDDRRDRFAHGRAVGRLIADLSCPDADPRNADCQYRIRNYLALDLVSPALPPDREAGGYFGEVSTLAQQVHRALDQWTAETDGSEPLVINLSIGWDGRHHGLIQSLQDELTAADCPSTDPALLWRAVRTALERASCLGALVIAAAGNADVDAPGVDEHPILPAAWEQVAAPDRDRGECGRFALEPAKERQWRYRRTVSSRYRPLVYAASAVGTRPDGSNVAAALPNARSKGFSRLVGPGLAAVTCDVGGRGSETEIGSGTSFGAAAVSGVAAAAWGLRPGLSSHDLVERIYTSGGQALDNYQPRGVGVADFVLGSCHPGTGCCPADANAPCRMTTLVKHCDAIRKVLEVDDRIRFQQCPNRFVSYRNPFDAVVPAGDHERPATLIDWNDPLHHRNRGVWGDHLAPWVRPSPEPTRCPPSGCKLDFRPRPEGYLLLRTQFENGLNLAPGGVLDVQLSVRALEQPAPTRFRLFTRGQDFNINQPVVWGLFGAPARASMAALVYAFDPATGLVVRTEVVEPASE